MSTGTITIDTGEWAYPDATGVTHAVTNAETFTFTLTDTSETDVRYALNTAQSVTADDGVTIEFQPLTDAQNGTYYFGPLADTQDDTTIYGLAGEMEVRDPYTGVVQIWKPATFKVDDVDAPTLINAKFEDQFGNSFTWTDVTVSVA